MAVDASSAFQVLASAISKFGFLFLLGGIGLYVFAVKKEWDSEHDKQKVLTYAKLSGLFFLACQLPQVLVSMIFK
jgi:hypothetical protein